jgi:hypothetical protein
MQESSLVSQELAYSFAQLSLIGHFHASSAFQGSLPGDPFQHDLMYLPEVVTSSLDSVAQNPS